MNILLVTVELAPYVAVTQAASSISSLVKALRLLGHDVTLVAPLLPGFQESGLMLARRLTPLSLPAEGEAHVYEVSLSSGARLVLLDTPHCPLAEIHSPEEGACAAWNAWSDAVTAFVMDRNKADQPFEVIHAHQLDAGLVLKKLQEAEVGTARVLSVYEADWERKFPAEAAKFWGTSPEGTPAATELKAALLRSVLSSADRVLVPSESCAEALRQSDWAREASSALRELVPVLGGVDTAIYNPATDTALPCRYDAPDPSPKGRVKTTLVQELGLPVEPRRPLIFFEESDKYPAGADLVRASLVQLVRQGVSVVLSLKRELSEAEQQVVASLQGEVRVLHDLDSARRRRLLGAADFYLHLDPRDCSGEGLMQAFRYGAIPIASAASVARDLVVDTDADLETGTGLLFDLATSRVLVSAVGRAVAAYSHPQWLRWVRRGMRQDVAWDRPARRHVQIYRQALGGGRSL